MKDAPDDLSACVLRSSGCHPVAWASLTEGQLVVASRGHTLDVHDEPGIRACLEHVNRGGETLFSQLRAHGTSAGFPSALNDVLRFLVGTGTLTLG
jgi:hypothetical protein